jgi:hypothetical protein
MIRRNGGENRILSAAWRRRQWRKNQYAAKAKLVKWRRETRLELAGWRHRLAARK